jgi:hypothetical protein
MDSNEPSSASPTPSSRGAGSVLVTVICVLVGLAFLLPGGLCSAMGLVNLAGGREERAYGGVFLAIGGPFAIGGIGLLYVAWRRIRRR